MQKNHEKYKKAFSEFSEHQTDQDAVVFPEAINPFTKGSYEKYKNMPVREIYDKMTATPKAKPNKVSDVVSCDGAPQASPFVASLLSQAGIYAGYQAANFGNAF